jgi:hypothetical protein
LDLSDLRIGLVTGCCENCNELTGSIETGELFSLAEQPVVSHHGLRSMELVDFNER